MEDVYEKIWKDNLRMRKEYLEKNSFIVEGEYDGNQLSRWRAAKLVFSVTDKYNNELFPSFQFENSEPIEIISVILNRLPSDMTQWQIALWFWGANGYIDGDVPQECLHNTDGLMLAAEEEANKVFG